MTQIHIALRRYLPDGESSAQGRIRCAPDRRRSERTGKGKTGR